jgi:LmbE family N-acetylglucosaminyl deacetylase
MDKGKASAKKTIVCIGAHPDDVELGMAGTAAKHAKRGDDVWIVICTLGIGGTSGDPRIREEEAERASRIIGARLQVIDYPVIKLNGPSAEFTGILRKSIQGIMPDRIYTHGPFDYHQVHEAVSRCTLEAAPDVHQILFYEEASSTSPEFRPNAYVDITDYMHLKLQSLQSHRTQTEKLYIQENITRSLAHTRYVLGKIGTRQDGMAEAFSIFRFLVTETDVGRAAGKGQSAALPSHDVYDPARPVAPA